MRPTTAQLAAFVALDSFSRQRMRRNKSIVFYMILLIGVEDVH